MLISLELHNCKKAFDWLDTQCQHVSGYPPFNPKKRSDGCMYTVAGPVCFTTAGAGMTGFITCKFHLCWGFLWEDIFLRVGWFLCQGWYYSSRSEFWIQEVQSLLGQAFQKSGLGRPSTKQTQKSRHNQCFCQHSNPKATGSTFVKVKVHLPISKSQPWFYAHCAFCFSFHVGTK